jgi:hypothetical protein
MIRPGAIVSSTLFGLVLLVMRQVLSSPACIDCGKRLVHADDCWRRRR